MRDLILGNLRSSRPPGSPAVRPAPALCLALAVTLASAAPGLAQPRLLGGLLPLDEEKAGRWPWSGTWAYPLADSAELAVNTRDGGTACRVLRGYSPADGREEKHLGMDIGNGHGGDPVRACAHGLVVSVKVGHHTNGFGNHVVLAHHLREGGIAYSVYSHLRPHSIRVRAGQPVLEGEVIARVGHTGRATTDHLHFEVRLADDPTLRWESTRTVDPAEFVERRLAHRADPGGVGPYLGWADRAGLIDPGADGEDVLTRALWQDMLARAACLPLLELPQHAPTLRDTLIAQGVLPEDEDAALDEPCSWDEVARDLSRLAEIGTRLPPGPLDAEAHRTVRLDRFGNRSPADLARDPRHRHAPPTVADACFLLAVLAGPAAAAGADPGDGSP